MSARGWLVVLVLAAVGQAYWVVLRPRMTAGPDGLEIVNGRDTTRLPWKEIRSAEPGITGFTVVATDGRRIVSRHPLQTQPAAKEPTEADTAAAYIAQRAAWERKRSGDRPEYVYPPAR